jgi:histidinol phosphatase-like enzyme (inositol monophosphatase family)
MIDTLDRNRLADLESFAIELAKTAAEEILPLFRQENGLEDKGSAKDGAFDPVTAADRGAEAAIRRAIAATYPDHGVIGEEYGEDRPDADFVWVLDPIDGTRGFIAGIPLWTTLIALRFQGHPVVGLIAQPYLDEIFVGTASGSRLLHRGLTTPLAVRPCPRLDQAVIVTTDPLMFKGADAAAWARLKSASRLARYSADAYAYALAALGQLDLVIETGLKAWDIEAAIPLLQGAGGSVTDWQGRAVGSSGGACLIAGDSACRDQAIAMLQA